jgi:hypothetical protein
MARAAQSLLVGAVFVLAAVACVASDIKLESGATLTINEIAYSRILPHAFYDQAISSLPHLFPSHVLLTGRRFGSLGDVAYSLVCFKETPLSERVVMQAAAVHRGRAWSLETVAPLSYADTLVQVLEQIGKLPSNPDVQRPPASGPR